MGETTPPKKTAGPQTSRHRGPFPQAPYSAACQCHVLGDEVRNVGESRGTAPGTVGGLNGGGGGQSGRTVIGAPETPCPSPESQGKP